MTAASVRVLELGARLASESEKDCTSPSVTVASDVGTKVEKRATSRTCQATLLKTDLGYLLVLAAKMQAAEAPSGQWEQYYRNYVPQRD